MSEVCEYAMILQTIMLTNVLNNNDSYVCSSSLYIRFPLNTIWSTTLPDRALIVNGIFAQLFFAEYGLA